MARLRLDDPDVEVEVRRSARARRLTLSVPHDGGPPRLSAPQAATDADLRMFLLRQADWLRGALARAPAAAPVEIGARMPYRGEVLSIVPRPGPRRPPRVAEGRIELQGGDASAAARRLAVWLREDARARITPIVADCAAALGARFGTITMRDTKGRWGSCTARGDLNFSWRLAMAPDHVLDYVAAHEAAHLREMNHGPRFWAHVERLRPDWRRSRDWLKTEGPTLHRYRFDL